MALSALALIFLLLALVAAAIWLISGRPSLEPVAAFFGSLAALVGAAALGATQVDRVWAIAIVVVGLGLFIWSVVRAFRLPRPLGGTSEYKPTFQQRLRNRRAMLKEEAREEGTPININTLDNYEKAVLREFFIQKRNTIRVPEENTAVSGLLQKGIISVVGDAKFLLGVGWTYPVSLSLSARPVILGSSRQIIGFPQGEPTREQITEIENLRPDFVWDIKRSDW